ncbi:MAG: hypothetical protein FWB91_02820 [Defluviitaleaceae bacterium]|nr:hypothetical protein [Defluviitaleaceae bacterium]
MIQDYFTDAEIADELGIDMGMVRDLLDGKGEWQTSDIDKLLDRLAKTTGLNKK